MFYYNNIILIIINIKTSNDKFKVSESKSDIIYLQMYCITCELCADVVYMHSYMIIIVCRCS